MEFLGYRRKDGRYGTRNCVLVLSSVACASGVVDAIGRALPEVVTINFSSGCGLDRNGLRVLSGMINNPNVGAVLVISLGCEGTGGQRLVESAQDKPAQVLVIQQEGGSTATTAKGIEIAMKMLKELKAQERVPAPISELVVGLECGGSDAFSGMTANPAVGVAADRFVEQGATVILSETTEMIGTAHILKRRGATPEIGEQVEKLVNDQQKRIRSLLGDLAGMVIAPGNIEGGLSSIAEKSLGCITKGGTTPINEVVEYAVRPSRRGLIVMDTPGYDIDSMAGLTAGGAQIILFTTGRGSTAGFPTVPVVKITSNSRTYNTMPGDMDINAGAIIDEDKTLAEVGGEIFDLSLRVASGQPTCAEINRSVPFGYLKQAPTF